MSLNAQPVFERDSRVGFLFRVWLDHWHLLGLQRQARIDARHCGHPLPQPHSGVIHFDLHPKQHSIAVGVRDVNPAVDIPLDPLSILQGNRLTLHQGHHHCMHLIGMHLSGRLGHHTLPSSLWWRRWCWCSSMWRNSVATTWHHFMPCFFCNSPWWSAICFSITIPSICWCHVCTPRHSAGPYCLCIGPVAWILEDHGCGGPRCSGGPCCLSSNR